MERAETEPAEALAWALFEDPATGVLVTDADGIVLRANETLRRRHGSASPGQPAAKLFAGGHRQEVEARIRHALSGHAPGPFPSALATPDEESVLVRIAALPAPDGTVRSLLIRIASQPVPVAETPSAKLQTLGHLASGIVHDVNNVLAAVASAAESMLGRPGLDAETRDDAQQIRAAAARGGALGRRILEFGRPSPPAPRLLPVNDAVRDAAGLLRRLFGGRTALELELEEPGALARIDPGQLDQVLLNLAINGRDAMPGGGTLRLRTWSRTLAQPLTWDGQVLPAGRYVVLEVGDEGAGIPAAVLPRVFDPFFTTRSADGGTGLGLSTVRDIVRAAGGVLTLDTAPGEGTRVRVQLPAVEAPPAPAGAAVLFVDDETAMLGVAERLFAGRGWRVLAADGAEAALDLAASEPPALVVSDIDMPGLDGVSLVRQLRRDCPALPAILVSGYAVDSLRRELAAESVAFLSKPYSFAKLIALAEQLVPR